MIGHRSHEYAELHRCVVEDIRTLFRVPHNAHIFLVAGSATLMMEAVIRNVVDGRVLHTINGAFSERWADISQSNNKQVEILEVPWGGVVEAETLRSTLQKNNDFDAVCFTHCETSTGALSPIAEYIEVVREESDALVCVDAVSSAGGVEIYFDQLNIDCLVFGTQKCFALPPGIAVAIVSNKAYQRAMNIDNRGYYTDFSLLEKYAQKHNTPATPNISLVYALFQKLRDITVEGMELRAKRHTDMQKKIIEWVHQKDLKLFPSQIHSSPTVSVIQKHRDIDIEDVCSRMRKKGFIIAPGYGQYKNDMFRIGHMGDHSVENVASLIDALDIELF